MDRRLRKNLDVSLWAEDQPGSMQKAKTYVDRSAQSAYTPRYMKEGGRTSQITEFQMRSAAYHPS